MARTKKSAPSRQPLTPGGKCPAERTNKSTDPAVTITASSHSYRDGVRTCGICGRENVPVHQSWGARHTAWYYKAHLVPVVDGRDAVERS